METLPSKSQGTTALGSLTPSTVLRELPKADAVNAIGDYLDKIAKLYQVPNWDAMNTVLLSEWIMDEYPAEQLKTVIKCLTRPRGGDKVWRLTPDTIKEWMTVELEKLAERRENYIHNKLIANPEPESWSEERLKEWEALIAETPAAKAIPTLTEEDIMKEGQELPHKPFYNPPGKEYKTMLELKAKYGRECTDLHTGKKKPGMLTFDEWILTQK